MPYTALILAAGYGNRMKPLTLDKHKSLIEVAGKPILERIIESLLKYGIQDFCIVTGYRDFEIKEFIKKKFKDLKVQFINNSDFAITNNIHSVSLALESIKKKQDIILIESDLIFKEEVIGKLINSYYENAALISKYEIGMDGTVIGKSDQRINAVYPPHLHDSNFNYDDKYKTLNIYKFSSDFTFGDFKNFVRFYSSMVDNSCYYELMLGIVIYMNRQNIYSVEVDSYDWAEVDDPNDLSVAEYLFNNDEKLSTLEDSHGGYWNYPINDYTFIRNHYYPTKSMISNMKGYFEKLIFNYGSSQKILNKKISLLEYLDENHTIALSGAAQIYPILSNYFKNKKVAIPDVTFGEYKRVFPKLVIYKDMLDSSGSIEQAIKNSELICFINPNNPSGKILESKYLTNLIESHKEKFFLIDESFIDYSEESSIIKLVRKDVDNFIILKSLSKSYGVPGIRLGYAYTKNIKIYNYIIDNLPIWGMNSLAENFLELSLKYRNELKKSFDKSKQDRYYLVSRLKKVSFINNILDSQASFVTFSVNNFWAKDLRKYLINNHNIYLKEIININNIGEKYFRVALTDVKGINFFVDSLEKYFNFKNK